MPVHFEWDRDLEEWDWSGAGEPPSEEFWSKFEELDDLGENLETLFAEVSGLEMVRNHDCMWAGSCSEEDCKKRRARVILEKPPVSLLVRPETPQPSETEDEPAVPVSQVTGQVRRGKTILRRPPSPPPQTQPQPQPQPQPQVQQQTTAIFMATSVSLDHDYERKKMVFRPEEFGLQTPSDSEEDDESSTSSSEDEEIDVVSVAPKNHQLPTNPTRRARHRLQETVADSLLTASRAVSRRLQATSKRKRCSSGSGRRSKRSRFCQQGSTDTERRSLHNNMERMRRVDLRNAFEDLRQLVPTIADTQKAAKVTILKDATHYVKELGYKDRDLCLQIEALRTEQERLRRTLSQLRRILAFKNIPK